MRECTGAVVELGTVAAVDNSGTLYIVDSVSHPGLRTPEIKALDGISHTAGEAVFYFLFDDGKGAILGSAE